jgi:hypothetical protein
VEGPDHLLPENFDTDPAAAPAARRVIDDVLAEHN